MSLIKPLSELGETIYEICDNPYLLFNCYIVTKPAGKGKTPKRERSDIYAIDYKAHIDKMAEFIPGKVEEISKHLIERQKSLLQNLETECYTTKSAVFVAKTPLLIGLGIPHPTENGYFFRQPYGFPTIPASSLKGVLRYYATEILSWDSTKINQIFGSQENIGGLIFFDAIPVEFRFKQEIQNPHYSEYYSSRGKTPPADYLDPMPITFLAVDRGSKFFISLASRNREALDSAWKALTEALSLIGIGAKTRTGYGILEVSK